MVATTSKSHRVKNEALQTPPARRSTSPGSLQRARTAGRYVRAHEAIINNEDWFGDKPPSLGKSFTAAKTAERQRVVIGILVRAAKRSSKTGNDQLAQACDVLADKLDDCRPRHRCGSFACPKCARAFQRANVAAEEAVIADLAKARPGKNLVMASVIPLEMGVRPDRLALLDIRKRNRWLKDALDEAGFNRVMFGSADMSWEEGYYQLHWHIAMWTSNRKKLTTRLKAIFPCPYRKPKTAY
jgi:hypothetical protein